MIPVSLIRDGILIIVAKLFRKKIIVFYRGWRVPTFNQILNNKLLRFLFNLIFQRGTNQIVLASSFKKGLLRLKKNQNREIIVTTTVINKDDIVLNTDLKDDKVIKILFLARIEALKGADEIIKAICILNQLGGLNNLEFTFVGHENNIGYVDSLKKYLKNNNVPENKVIFKGRITGRDKFNQYANHHLYLLPSYTEGCPNSVLEALASGLFCITTPVGALAELIIPNENGILVKVKSVDNIVDAILKCKSNMEFKNKRNQISRNAIKNLI